MIFLASSSTRFTELQKMMDWLICNCISTRGRQDMHNCCPHQQDRSGEHVAAALIYRHGPCNPVGKIWQICIGS